MTARAQRIKGAEEAIAVPQVLMKSMDDYPRDLKQYIIGVIKSANSSPYHRTVRKIHGNER